MRRQVEALLFCNIEKNLKTKNHIDFLGLSAYLCTRKTMAR